MIFSWWEIQLRFVPFLCPTQEEGDVRRRFQEGKEFIRLCAAGTFARTAFGPWMSSIPWMGERSVGFQPACGLSAKIHAIHAIDG
jgi:hypothetical protein